jgi:hypothetical protein
MKLISAGGGVLKTLTNRQNQALGLWWQRAFGAHCGSAIAELPRRPLRVYAEASKVVQNGDS